MSRVIALCFLLLAAVIGFLHIDSRPAWAPFAVESVTTTEEELELQPSASAKQPKTPIKSSIPTPVDTWLPETGAPSVHAASLIALQDGAIRAFWFAGSREGAADVVINSAVFDPKSSSWSAPTVVMDRVSAEKGLSRYVAKLGNPVPARMADGRLQLFFVTVSIGGWAGSSISSVISDDEGLTWAKPQRLISSPLINLSTLVKSPTLVFADGRLGLPAYHEWVGRFGEFLRVEAGQVIDKRRMSSGRSAIQPLVFVNSAQDATALFRQTRSSSQPKQIPVSQTQNAGQAWQLVDDLPIANPNSAVAGVQLGNGTRILVLNNIEAGRYRLVLMMRDAQSSDWQIVQTLEDDSALPNDQRHEFSYPYLITVNGNDAHLVYTWDRKKIRHRYFSGAFLKYAQSQLSHTESAIPAEESKQ
jgi:predicted neuraminidase